jgi:L-iditol 2-dehydrogenase
MNCPACQRQIYSACRQYSFIGSRVSGGFAEYLNLPASSLIPLPDQVDCEVGALIEPASVALYSLERGEVKPGQRVAILGVGSIGLFTVQWARAKEAGHIIATDVVDERLQAATSMGAHTTLNPAQSDVVAEVRELTGDGVDIALEISGTPQALEQAILMTRPRGRIVCVGNQPEGATMPLSLIEHIIRQELDVRGVWMSYTAPFPGHMWTDTISAAQRGDLELNKMISHRFPLSAVPDLFQQIHAGSLSYRKIIISP